MRTQSITSTRGHAIHKCNNHYPLPLLNVLSKASLLKTKSVNNVEHTVNFVVLNVRSARSISLEIHNFVVDEKIDMFFLTETWLYEKGDEVFIQEMTPSDYKFYSFPRTNGQVGGGLGVMCSNHLVDKMVVSKLDYITFEAIEVKLFDMSTAKSFICIYRPPRSKKNKFKTSDFRNEFNQLLSYLNNVKRDILITGDLNFHYDNTNDTDVQNILSLLDEHSLKQLVDSPTHKAGHTLDWFITRSASSFCLHKVKDLALSDHYALFGSVEFKRPVRTKRLVTSRNIKAINESVLFEYIHKMAEDAEKLNCENVDNLIIFYNQQLSKILDNLAPKKTRSITDRQSAPWRDEELFEAKRTERKAERVWRNTGLTIHREIYVIYRNKTKSLNRKKRKDHNCNKIEQCGTTKEIYNCTNELLGKSKNSPLPNNIPRSDLPNIFNNFFEKKICDIRKDLDDANDNELPVPECCSYTGLKMNTFHVVDEDFVKKLLHATAPKSCQLDPIPTHLLKNADELLPLITKIINASLQTGVVPDQLKEAIVKPLLKKPGLDQNELKNYRPVSNLSFLSKILEKVVLLQLQTHLESNDLFESYQSAYRKFHSTETALLHVLDNLLIGADENVVSLLSLLDLSAAFDTIDHLILLQRLKFTFGIDGVVLKWFTSYLENRKQYVLIDGHKSNLSTLRYGVPQGSVLGPVLFTLYTQPLSDILNKNKCDYHKFADDTQLSKQEIPSNFPLAIQCVESCIEEVSLWMRRNKLKLNPDKTEFISIGSRSKLNDLNVDNVYVKGKPLKIVSSVKNLGVFIDSTLTMKKHVSQVCKSAYFELRRISHLKKYLNTAAIKQLITSLVLSRIDYCNSLLAGLPYSSIDKLQKLQNNAARLILRKSKRDHVTPMLADLHWLPVKYRIMYKLAVFGYRYFENTLPSYLRELLQQSIPSRPLRSSNDKRLLQPKRKRVTYGERAFSFQVPKVWNSLPKELKNATSLETFRKHLKTHFYLLAFS